MIFELPFRSEDEPEALNLTSEHEHETLKLTREQQELKGRMAENGFVLVEEGVEEGVDDWVDLGLRGRSEGRAVVVRCLWWVWRWG